VLQGHGDHVEADNEGNEDVQVVAGAHGVDEQPGGTVGGIVGQPLGLCMVWREWHRPQRVGAERKGTEHKGGGGGGEGKGGGYWSTPALGLS
jgi:hypothetical protein